MKKLIIATILILLTGCTLQEGEVKEISDKLSDMGEHLELLDKLANKHDFPGFEKEVKNAEKIRDDLSSMIKEADSRGENQEFVDRAKKASAFLETQFETLINIAELLQDIEKVKPLVEELDDKDTSNIDETKELTESIVSQIDDVVEEIASLEELYEDLDSREVDTFHAKETISRMKNFESDISKTRSNFSNLLQIIDNIEGQE